MTRHVLTRSADGLQFAWQFGPSMTLAQSISAALEFTGPGATFVRSWQEGDW